MMLSCNLTSVLGGRVGQRLERIGLECGSVVAITLEKAPFSEPSNYRCTSPNWQYDQTGGRNGYMYTDVDGQSLELVMIMYLLDRLCSPLRPLRYAPSHEVANCHVETGTKKICDSNLQALSAILNNGGLSRPTMIHDNVNSVPITATNIKTA